MPIITYQQFFVIGSRGIHMIKSELAAVYLYWQLHSPPYKYYELLLMVYSKNDLKS